jgi:hypothetical protein
MLSSSSSFHPPAYLLLNSACFYQEQVSLPTLANITPSQQFKFPTHPSLFGRYLLTLLHDAISASNITVELLEVLEVTVL